LQRRLRIRAGSNDGIFAPAAAAGSLYPPHLSSARKRKYDDLTLFTYRVSVKKLSSRSDDGMNTY